MRRYFESLGPADRSAIDSVPDGLFLVRVDRVQYRWHVQKPYYSIRFGILEPNHLAGCLITGRLYCTTYIDAVGRLDNRDCLLEWKTTSARYPEEPDGLLALDPQLVCYSWITGISEVAQVVFVRKRLIEIQYLRTTISDEHRREFGQLVEATIRQIESAQFLPHSGIRFPQNPAAATLTSDFVWENRS
jgi:hypothetical protein